MSEQTIQIKPFVEPMFGENALLVSTAAGENRVGWVIDPSFKPHIDRLVAHARDQQIRIEKIILTHGHGDHIAGVDVVAEAFPQAELLIAREDEPMLRNANLNLSAPFGVSVVVDTEVAADLAAGLEMTLGATRWHVLDTSGHSPGGRSLFCPEAGVVIVGDALFAGSIGRTDFPGSNTGNLISNIRRHLLSLPGSTVVYPGHGPTTTVENERKSNPFLVEESS